MDNSKYILEMKDITKTFPGVVALDRVQLCVKKGTVHGVVAVSYTHLDVYKRQIIHVKEYHVKKVFLY